MTQTIITVICAVFASSGFWALMQTIINRRSASKTAEQKLLIGLAHDRIYALCNEYIARGSVTLAEYDNLNAIYQPYAAAGGNGTGKKLFDQVETLPLIDN